MFAVEPPTAGSKGRKAGGRGRACCIEGAATQSSEKDRGSGKGATIGLHTVWDYGSKRGAVLSSLLYVAEGERGEGRRIAVEPSAAQRNRSTEEKETEPEISESETDHRGGGGGGMFRRGGLQWGAQVRESGGEAVGGCRGLSRDCRSERERERERESQIDRRRETDRQTDRQRQRQRQRQRDRDKE